MEVLLGTDPLSKPADPPLVVNPPPVDNPAPPPPLPDVIPPETSITAGPSGTVSTASASFSFIASESGSTFECRRDEGAWGSCSSPKAYSGLANGLHSFDVRATDAAGNTDLIPASRTWTVSVATPDTTPPNTTIASGPSGTVGSSSASFSFTSSEAGSTFQCRLDAGTWGACSSPKSYSGLANGPHTFDVRAIDSAGNTDGTPGTRTWTVDVATADTSPPDTTIASGPSGTVGSSSASFSFTSSEAGSTFQCRLDTGAWGSCITPKAYSGLANGPHNFDVRAIDSAGNADATPGSRTWTVDVAPSTGTCDRNATTSTFASQVSAATAGQTICLASGSYGTWSGTNKPITIRKQDGATATMKVAFTTGDSGFALDGPAVWAARSRTAPATSRSRLGVHQCARHRRGREAISCWTQFAQQHQCERRARRIELVL